MSPIRLPRYAGGPCRADVVTGRRLKRAVAIEKRKSAGSSGVFGVRDK